MQLNSFYTFYSNSVILQDRLGLPRVCDLFSCLKLDGDNQKWLHHTPLQVRHLLIKQEILLYISVKMDISDFVEEIRMFSFPDVTTSDLKTSR